MDTDRQLLFLEVALSAIMSWMLRHDVQDEVMRRARCNLSAACAAVLAKLDKCGPMRIGALALALGIDNSTITPQIQRLERDGLIARHPDPSDARAWLLSATEEGHLLIARLHRSRLALLQEKLVDWPIEERAAITRAMQRLASALAPI